MNIRILTCLSPIVGIAVTTTLIIGYSLYLNDAPLSGVFFLFGTIIYYYLVICVAFLIVSIPIYILFRKYSKTGFINYQICSLIPFGIFGIVMITIVGEESIALELRVVDYIYYWISIFLGSAVSGLIYWVANLNIDVRI